MLTSPAHAALYAAERLHQARASGALYRWRYALWALTLPALLTALILFWGEFAGAVTARSTAPIAAALHGLAVYTRVLTYALYAAVLLLALVRAVSSITREMDSGTWSLLALTHADARGIVIAKWWATVRGLDRQLWLLVVLRAGMAVWIGAEQSRMTYLLTAAVVPSRMLPPDPLKILLTLPLMAVFTFVSVGAVVAIGVLMAVLIRRRMAALAAAFLAVTFVFALLVGAAAIGSRAVTFARAMPRQTRDYAQPYAETLALTALDNGNGLAMRLVDYDVQYNYRPERYVMLYNQQRFNLTWWAALITVCGVYALAGLGALRLAQAAAERAGALPPAPARRTKLRRLARPVPAISLV